MSRIERTLEALKGQGRKALIPYITAGDPHPDATVGLMHTWWLQVPTSSSWACRFPIPWPTVRLSSWPVSVP